MKYGDYVVFAEEPTTETIAESMKQLILSLPKDLKARWETMEVKYRKQEKEPMLNIAGPDGTSEPLIFWTLGIKVEAE